MVLVAMVGAALLGRQPTCPAQTEPPVTLEMLVVAVLLSSLVTLAVARFIWGSSGARADSGQTAVAVTSAGKKRLIALKKASSFIAAAAPDAAPPSEEKDEKDADPRVQLLEFFDEGDQRGPLGVLRNNEWVPPGPKRAAFFSVWRPTSNDAIQMMIEGKATGKGLNVKGESAKKGVLSMPNPCATWHALLTTPPLVTRVRQVRQEGRALRIRAVPPNLRRSTQAQGDELAAGLVGARLLRQPRAARGSDRRSSASA